MLSSFICKVAEAEGLSTLCPKPFRKWEPRSKCWSEAVWQCCLGCPGACWGLLLALLGGGTARWDQGAPAVLYLSSQRKGVWAINWQTLLRHRTTCWSCFSVEGCRMRKVGSCYGVALVKILLLEEMCTCAENGNCRGWAVWRWLLALFTVLLSVSRVYSPILFLFIF